MGPWKNKTKQPNLKLRSVMVNNIGVQPLPQQKMRCSAPYISMNMILLLVNNKWVQLTSCC